MICSTPGLPVHHQLPEFTQTHTIQSVIHPAISSSVVPFSSCPQSLPASESFPMSQLFTWSGQSTGVSALASFLPKNTQRLISFRMDWLDLLAVQGTLKSLLQHKNDFQKTWKALTGLDGRYDSWWPSMSKCVWASSCLSCDKSQSFLVDETPGEGIYDNWVPLEDLSLDR